MSQQDEQVAARRAAALRELGVLDMPPTAVFNTIVTLASAICERPMAAISLTDVDRQWLLSEVGVGTNEIPLGIAFCRHGLNAERVPMDIPDAREDDRFRDNPLVTGGPAIRSYTGVPIVVGDDVPIGMLCVLAPEPGHLDADQMQALSLLAALTSDLLRAHKATDALAESRRETDVARGLAADAARRAHAVFAGVPTPFVVTDADGVVLQTNPAFDDLVGGEPRRNYLGLLTSAERESEHLLLHDLWRTERDTAAREVTLTRADGSELPALVTSTVARDADGRPHSILNRVEDISMRRQAEIELRESQSAIDGIVTLDRRRHIVSWNDGAARLLGHSRADAIGKHVDLLFPTDGDEARTFAALADTTVAQQPGRPLELDTVTATGERLPIELSLSRWQRHDQPFHTAVFRDLTERRREEAHQLWLSTHDATTGLGNLTALRQWHEAKADDAQAVAIFSLQLLNLDVITSAFGAETAKDVLRHIGRALVDLNDETREICHLGDALFAGAGVLNGPVDDPDDELLALAKLVTDAAGGPFLVDGAPLEIQVQLGIVAAPKRDAGLTELLRQAEATRTRSPRRVNIGSGTAVDLNAGTDDLVLIGEMRTAVAEDQLVLHYQPITRLQPVVHSVHAPVTAGATCPLPTLEALVRWQHPDRGLLSPNTFIPLVETGPMITLLTDWVLRSALRQQRQWQDDGSDVIVAVNLSAQVLLNDDVLSMVATALDETGADPTRLKIEITESAIVADPEETRDIVLALRAMGVGVSLDDFGTGYTSLKLLRDLPVDEIKLDRLFVADATASPADAAIANAVSQLAHRLAIRTVAEGIEDDETLSLFRALGFDYVQGYVIARPMPVEDATTWLRRHRTA